MTLEWDAQGYVPTDQLVGRIERALRTQGATFDDIDERIALELGVPVAAWSGYQLAKTAAERYQHEQRRGRRQNRGVAGEHE